MKKTLLSITSHGLLILWAVLLLFASGIASCTDDAPSPAPGFTAFPAKPNT